MRSTCWPPRRMTGQGGWPMSVFLTPDRLPFYAGTYFPPAPRHGLPGFPQVLEAISAAWSDRRDEVLTSAESISAQLSSSAAPAAAAGLLTAEGLCRRGRAAAGRVRSGAGRLRRRAEVPAVDGAGGAAPRRRRGRDDHGRADLHRDGPRRHLRPAGRRVRPLQRRCRLGGAALREDALRQRPAARGLHPLVAARRRTLSPSGWWPRPSTGCSARCGRRRAPSPRAWTPTRSTIMAGCARAPTTPGPGTSSSACSGTRTRPGRREVFGVTAAGTFEDGSVDPAAAGRSRRRRPAGRASGPASEPPGTGGSRPGRDDKVVAAWNGWLIDSLVQAATGLRPSGLAGGRDRGGERDLAGALAGRPVAPGVAGRPCRGAAAGSWRTTRRWPRPSSRLAAATGGRRLDRTRRGAARGGTGASSTTVAPGSSTPPADAEQLYTRPQDPTDNATPSGLSAALHALGG